MGETHGYRIRSPETWARARADFESGFTVGEVCDRHDLGLSAVRARIRREGWRRPEDELGLDDDEGPDLSYAEIADLAWRRMVRAVRKGCSTEALRWMRLYDRLIRLTARAAAREHEPADVPAPKTYDRRPAPAAALHVARPNPHEAHDVRIFSAMSAAVAPDRTGQAPLPPEARAQAP